MGKLSAGVETGGSCAIVASEANPTNSFARASVFNGNIISNDVGHANQRFGRRRQQAFALYGKALHNRTMVGM